ncbi:terminase TerL endonuclease subunit [Lactiplantibacillus plantarum]|uniref:terminase large subunit n=1 Tax=Lactiplantibacillus plantarum TaxID=1590 RepID=UPI0030B7CADD
MALIARIRSTKDVLTIYRQNDFSDIYKKYRDAGTQYAFSVLDGKQVAGYLMHLACLRHLNDLMDSIRGELGYYYSVDDCRSILNFAKLCPDVDTGEPIQLMPWQQFILCQLIGWRDPNGDKRFTDACVSVARGQGKTYFAAIISAYAFMIETVGMSNQDMMVASNNTEQAKKLYGYVSFMVQHLIDDQGIFKQLADELTIECQSMMCIAKTLNNRLLRLSNESGKFDSYHFTTAIYDEAGDEKAGKNTSKIVTGQSKVKNHQFIRISTAYEFLETEFRQDLRRGQTAMEDFDSHQADNQLWLIWSQDNPNEVYRPETWEKSNPLLNLSAQHDRLLAGLKNLRSDLISRGKLAEFQNKSMNIYLQTSTAGFIKTEELEKAKIESFDIDGKDVYIGFDSSMFSDNTAVGFAYPYGDGEFHIQQYSFIPWRQSGSIEAKEKADGLQYRTLAERGFCQITSQEQGLINIEEVYHWLLEFVEHHQLNVLFFGYDRLGSYQVKSLVNTLEVNTSWPIVDVAQNTSSLMDPTKFIQTAFAQGKVSMLKDPVFEKALMNAQVMENKVGIQVDKAKATLKIDVVDALIDAFFQGMYHFSDYAPELDSKTAIDRMTPEQVKEWLRSDKFSFGGQ